MQAKYDQLNHEVDIATNHSKRIHNTPDIPTGTIVTKNLKTNPSLSNVDVNGEQFQRCQAQLQTMVQQLEKLQEQQQMESTGLHKLVSRES